MKYTITIEHYPQNNIFPFIASIKNPSGWICNSGKTQEEAENGLIEKLKKLGEKQETIVKDIEI